MSIKTTSLEVSKKLKEARWNLKWSEHTFTSEKQKTYLDAKGNDLMQMEYFPAPTISELLEELPKVLYDSSLIIDMTFLESVKSENFKSWSAKYLRGNQVAFVGSSSLLEDALALLWIELKEKNII